MITDYDFSDGYTLVLHCDEDGDIVASVSELRGCIGHGETLAQALTMIQEMKQAWLELARAGNMEIPSVTREAQRPASSSPRGEGEQ